MMCVGCYAVCVSWRVCVCVHTSVSKRLFDRDLFDKEFQLSRGVARGLGVTTQRRHSLYCGDIRKGRLLDVQ